MNVYLVCCVFTTNVIYIKSRKIDQRTILLNDPANQTNSVSSDNLSKTVDYFGLKLSEQMIYHPLNRNSEKESVSTLSFLIVQVKSGKSKTDGQTREMYRKIIETHSAFFWRLEKNCSWRRVS